MGIRSRTSLLSRWAGVALLTGCLVTSAEAQVEIAVQSAVLEIIVKFSDASEAGRLVNRYIDKNFQDLGELAEIADQLHASTGFVLTPERVTSGRELVVGIPERPLLEKVRAAVIERAEVSAAEIVTIQTNNPRLTQAQLLVSFRQLTDEAELLKNAFGEDTYDERVRALAAELCAPSGVPVHGDSESGDVLAVIVNRFDLLETIVAQLKSLDYVDYAQPNATVQIVR